MDQQEINRMLLRFEQLLRETNREVIHPLIQILSLEDMRPVAELVARARGIYLRELYQLAHKYKGKSALPTDEEMEELAKDRKRYMDLVDASKSVEIAIQRGYLDIRG